MTHCTPAQARKMADNLEPIVQPGCYGAVIALRSLADQVESLTAELDALKQALSHPKSIATAEPSGWIYMLDGHYSTFSKEKPEEDNYDPGTLRPVFFDAVVPAPMAQPVEVQRVGMTGKEDAFRYQWLKTHKAKPLYNKHGEPYILLSIEHFESKHAWMCSNTLNEAIDAAIKAANSIKPTGTEGGAS